MRNVSIGAFTLLVAQITSAQFTELVPSKTWNPDSVPRSPSEVRDSWSGALNAAAWWVNLYADNKVKQDVKLVLEKSIAAIAKDLEWTGEGALVNVRLIRKSSPNSPLKAVGILGDQAWYAGTGRTAEDALFSFWRTPQLRPGVPQGWTEDPLGNNYFWVTLNSAGKPQSTVVPRGLADDLNSKLTANFGQYALDYYKRSWQATDTWLNIAKTARARLIDQASKKALDKAWEEVKASQARVAEANAKLEKALESERKAARALQFVQTLQGILTVAQLVQEVRTMLDEPLPELSKASTAEAVINTANGIVNGKRVERAKMEAAFDGTYGDLQKYLTILGEMAKKAGAPRSVEGKTRLEPGPKP